MRLPFLLFQLEMACRQASCARRHRVLQQFVRVRYKTYLTASCRRILYNLRYFCLYIVVTAKYAEDSQASV